MKNCKFFLYFFSLLFISSGIQSQNIEDNLLVGENDIEPGYSYGLNGKDIINGTKYFFLKNDSVTVIFGSTSVLNNQQGSRHPGAVMDFILKSKNRDNLDWTMFQLNSSIINDANDNTKSINVDSVNYNTLDTSINVFGKAKYNSTLSVVIKYRLLPNSPILKIKVSLKNLSSVVETGNISYFIDPDDASQENSYVPGKGTNAGVINSGWSDNYIYSGILGNGISNFQNHALAWLNNQPNKLVANSFNIGLFYNYVIQPNATIAFEFYHITDVANNIFANGSTESITQWSSNLIQYDPDYANSFQKITGKIKDQYNKAIKDVYVRLIDKNGIELSKTKSNEFGEYKLLSPILTVNSLYVLSADKVGFVKQTKKFYNSIKKSYTYNFDNADNSALKNASVDISFTKRIFVDGAVSTQQDDIVLENNYVVLGIYNPKRKSPNLTDSKLSLLDFYLKSTNLDLLDFIKLSKVSYVLDSLSQWSNTSSYIIDTIYVKDKSSLKVTLRIEGHLTSNVLTGISSNLIEDTLNNVYTIDPNISNIFVENDITLEYGKKFFTIKTVIVNKSNQEVCLYLGDVLRTFGSNTRSYVPGYGELKKSNNHSSISHLLKPILPWFANYSNYQISYGIIYEKNPDFFYFDNSWISSVHKIIMKPNDSSNISRAVVVTNNTIYSLFKHKGVEAVYAELSNLKSKLNLTLVGNYNRIYSIGDTLNLSLKYFNYSNQSIRSKLQIIPPANFHVQQIDTLVTINKLDTLNLKFHFKVLEGGRYNFKFNYSDENNSIRNRELQVFSNGTGWYSGDTHTHSLFSDGAGSIEQNLLYGKNVGLSFIAASDHNTISHFSLVDSLNLKYNDFIVLPAEEITTTQGHCLAYNINTLVPWNLQTYSKKFLIDSVNRQINSFGSAFSYIAHPNVQYFEWADTTFFGTKGLEVWNSIDLDFSFNNIRTRKSFSQWDSLNLLGRHIFGMSNSDAHGPNVVGSNYIVAKLNEFSKSEIIKVLRDRGTFYGTNGPSIVFTMNNSQMGETVFITSEFQNILLRISANSNSVDNISEIKLYKNGNVIRIWENVGQSIIIKEPINVSPGDFFRLELTAGSGFAFSNPIWISQNLISPNSINNSYSDSSINVSVLQNSKLSVNPNPANTEFEVFGLLPQINYTYSLKTLQGKTVSVGSVSTSSNSISLNDVFSDIYILNIYPEIESSNVKRLLVVVKKD
jgi:hypothetical protein